MFAAASCFFVGCSASIVLRSFYSFTRSLAAPNHKCLNKRLHGIYIRQAFQHFHIFFILSKIPISFSTASMDVLSSGACDQKNLQKESNHPRCTFIFFLKYFLQAAAAFLGAQLLQASSPVAHGCICIFDNHHNFFHLFFKNPIWFKHHFFDFDSFIFKFFQVFVHELQAAFWIASGSLHLLQPVSISEANFEAPAVECSSYSGI